jgi:hypothetical protein
LKSIFLVINIFLTPVTIFAQIDNNKDLFAFAITDYLLKAGDTISVVQVQLPQRSKIIIEKGQIGLLKYNYSNVKDDTSKIGWGKCSLIKENNYFFGLHLYNKINSPQKNDILYTKIYYPAKYKGRVYNLVKDAIYFEHIGGGNFYDFNSPALLDEQMENKLTDSLVADIKFTGSELFKQNDGQDQDISSGIFKGKKLFAAMQTITVGNVNDFIDYVIARPGKYIGNTWKISETFATWMVSGTPTVIKN